MMIAMLLIYRSVMRSPPVAKQLLYLGPFLFSPQPPALKVEDVLSTDNGEDDDAEEEKHEDNHDHRVLCSR